MILLPGTVVRVEQPMSLGDIEQRAYIGTLGMFCPVGSILTIVGSKTTSSGMRAAYVVLFEDRVFRTGYDFHKDGTYLNSVTSPFTVLAKP